eukprot:jgi/Astpho2/8802/Aster-05445
MQGTATFLAKADGVLAGLAVADLVFSAVDPCLSVHWNGRDGARVAAGTKFGTVTGSARSILVAERIALNFMQRMGGIATATAEMVELIQGTGAKVLETRKTVPCLRVPDKWAVLIGGGANHRMGLFDMVMIKDNHVTAAGGVAPAIQRAQEFLARKQLTSVPIEVETRTLEEVQEVLSLMDHQQHEGVARLMLDNMTRLDSSKPGQQGGAYWGVCDQAKPEAGSGEKGRKDKLHSLQLQLELLYRAASGVDVSMLQQAVRLVSGRLETEASGNITADTIRTVAETGVTYISCGSLTHSVEALDISLKIQVQQA